MDMDFAVSCPLVRRWRLVSGFCPSTRTFDPCFFQTPPRGGSPCIISRPSPPSGWPEDFHLQTAEHAQHTTKGLLRHANLRCAPSPPADKKQTKTPPGEQSQCPLFRCYRPQMPSSPPPTASNSSSPKFSRRLNAHSPAASAANAGGFLQTSLSEVIRRSPFRRAPALTRRITPDRVIAYSGSAPKRSGSGARAHLVVPPSEPKRRIVFETEICDFR
jgi:hypothetical protein